MNFFLLGLDDIWVALAVWASLAVTLCCIIYGAVNWNHGGGKDGE